MPTSFIATKGNEYIALILRKINILYKIMRQAECRTHEVLTYAGYLTYHTVNDLSCWHTDSMGKRLLTDSKLKPGVPPVDQPLPSPATAEDLFEGK